MKVERDKGLVLFRCYLIRHAKAVDSAAGCRQYFATGEIHKLGVRPRPKVGYLPKEFERVRLRLDRIGLRLVYPAEYLDFGGLNLQRLPLSLGFDEYTGCRDRTAGSQLEDLHLVIGQVARRDDLKRAKCRPIRQMQERKAGLGVASGANPALDPHGRPRREAAGENVGYAGLGL